MKQALQHEKYGEIVYEENFWTGKKSIAINGVSLTKVTKKEYQMSDGTTVTITGNFLQGASLIIDSEIIRLTPKWKWYEMILFVLPFALIMVWGNVVELCKIVPVVGGAIGGAISGLTSFIGLFLMRSVKPWWLKVLIGLLVTGITFGICCGIGFAIVTAAS